MRNAPNVFQHGCPGRAFRYLVASWYNPLAMNLRGFLYFWLLGAAVAAAAPPNIVVIVSDDQGWRDAGYHGAEFPTPNIDRIAAEGVELDRFCVTPVCSPTRAGLLTGRYPLRFGLQRITVKRWRPRAIPEDEVLLPRALAKAGYRIRAMVGKWHAGWSKRAPHPMSRGFTSFYGLGGGAVGFFTHQMIGAVPKRAAFFGGGSTG